MKIVPLQQTSCKGEQIDSNSSGNMYCTLASVVLASMESCESLIHLLSIHLRHPSVWSGGPSTTSRSSPRSTLSRATFEILLISIPLVVGVVPRSIELGLCVATVWSVGEGRAVAIVSPSESISWAPVAVDEAAGPAGAAPGHAPAVVVRLAVPGEARALLGSLLVAPCHGVTLLWGAVVGTDHCLELLLLEI